MDITRSSASNTGSTQGTVEQVKQQASQVIGTVQDRATTQANTQKEQASQSLSTVAQAVRQASGHLRENQQSPIAGYVDMAATQIENAANYLRDHEIPEILNETQRIAQRQPVLFLAGAFALGMLGARFLKSSAPASTNTPTNYNVPQTNYGRTHSTSTADHPEYSDYTSGTGYSAQSYPSNGPTLRNR